MFLCNKKSEDKLIMMKVFFICMPEYKPSEAEPLLQKQKLKKNNNKNKIIEKQTELKKNMLFY